MTEEILCCNGQSIYRLKTPPHQLDRRCEVFVGRIPRDCGLEEDLVPLFKKVGQLLEFRLLISFSGHCRGFGFAIYATKQEAQQAILEFDNFEIRFKWYLGVCWSLNKCKISLWNIPAELPFYDVAEFIYGTSDSCIPGDPPLYIICSEWGENDRRKVVWEHRTHRTAALNRKYITGPAAAFFGPQTQVMWVDPGIVINYNTFPLMATRSGENILISEIDINVVYMYDRTTEERAAMSKKNEAKHFRNDKSNLLNRRKAHVPKLVLDPSQKLPGPHAEWENLPLTTFISSERMIPRNFSSSNFQTVNAATPISKFTFDNLGVLNGGNCENAFSPVTPASSGYESLQNSPSSSFKYYYNSGNRTSSDVMPNEDIMPNVWSPSFSLSRRATFTPQYQLQCNTSMIPATTDYQNSFGCSTSFTPKTMKNDTPYVLNPEAPKFEQKHSTLKVDDNIQESLNGVGWCNKENTNDVFESADYIWNGIGSKEHHTNVSGREFHDWKTAVSTENPQNAPGTSYGGCNVASSTENVNGFSENGFYNQTATSSKENRNNIFGREYMQGNAANSIGNLNAFSGPGPHDWKQTSSQKNRENISGKEYFEWNVWRKRVANDPKEHLNNFSGMESDNWTASSSNENHKDASEIQNWKGNGSNENSEYVFGDKFYDWRNVSIIWNMDKQGSLQ